jgi:HSP20 family protein
MRNPVDFQQMETRMAETPVTVKKAPTPTQPRANVPDVWQSFRSEMDRLFDRFGFPSFRRMFDVEPFLGNEASFGVTVPAVDVSEDDQAYKITAELPGLDQKDIDVSVTGDVLVIKGEKRQEREEKDKNRYLSERSYGAFQRNFSLPDGVERDKISADFAKGVLTLTLPKTAEAQKQQKKIEVKAG